MSSIDGEIGSAPAHAWHRWALDNATASLLLAAIAAAIAAQLALAVVRQVNWDEFYFLARIFEYQRGELEDALLTFHVHLFGWVATLPGDEIDRIVVGRLAMLGLEIGTLLMIFQVARRFASRDAALWAVAAYVTCSNVILHGASFRFDPLATFLLMSALALLLAERLGWRQAAAAGVLIAVAGLVTIKSVFYLPVVVAVAFWRIAEGPDRRANFLALLYGGIAAAASFAALYVAHAMALSDRVSLAQPEAFLSHSIATMIDFGGILSKWTYLVDSMAGNPILWAGIAVGLLARMSELVRPTTGAPRRWLLLAFIFPLATVVFYRNSFPYFYVFALAPASVLVAVAVDALRWPAGRMLRLVAVLFIVAAMHVVGAFSTGQAAQRATLQAVHRIFAEPVSYIDRCSMVGSFRKVGFFMSTWGTETYRASAQPSFPDLLRAEQPVFVLANSPALEAAFGGKAAPELYALLPRDATALRQNYVHHWGAIWVAGKTFAEVGPLPQDFEILISGAYTVEAPSGVVIDGRAVEPGAVIRLEQGPHTLRVADGSAPVLLRWGDRLPLPIGPAPTEAVFNGF